jgi:hypothetical protein
LVLEEAGLPARATKDLDIVLCVEVMDAAFGEKVWSFIEAGGYALREKDAEPRQFYRFQRPSDPRSRTCSSSSPARPKVFLYPRTRT